MGCGQSKPLNCPRCKYKFINAEDFIYHLERQHDLKEGSKTPGKTVFSCPKCSLQHFQNEAELVDHCERDHPPAPVTRVAVKPSQNQVMPGVEVANINNNLQERKPIKVGNKSFPRVGDKVLAMWSLSQWQYFHATVKQFIQSQLQFEIDWDDPDPTGRIVDYYNLALDKSPNPNEISVGSVVLFPQGKYVGGPSGGIYGGVRWHQGKITKIHSAPDGSRLFDGCHTKGQGDGKWITYAGYEFTFSGYKLEDLRVGPNVFDILDDNGMEETSDEDIDIYFSYTPTDSLQAIKNNEAPKSADKYQHILDNLCDPRNIAKSLKGKGLKVAERKANSSEDLIKTAIRIKKAKVFIACISDQYVANDECRMEFQYAKTTVGIPIVPLVVGDGSFEWTLSVVGMLIAGELYIHFKDQSVEESKLSELHQTLTAHFDNKVVDDINNTSIKVEGPGDVFISYNWTNSFKAKEAKQINQFVGCELSDPRLVAEELGNRGFNKWLDIERLRSANAKAGMYEQLTSALKEAKVVLAFVSNEYSNSPNCRMEFQFAMKTLKKPMVSIIVGEGDEWKTSVIGRLVQNSSRKIISVGHVATKEEFKQLLEQIIVEINIIIGTEGLHSVEGTKVSQSLEGKKVDHRAPKIGDHVVSHHIQCAYYMATIVSFNQETLEYTIDWDDGDPTGRVQPYNQVALDVEPDIDDVGVGSIIFFPQGTYDGTDGNNEGGQRYHEGIVTSCKKSENIIQLSGHHTKGENDDKWVTFKDYTYEFNDITLNKIRVAPSAMDALMAAKA